MTWYWFFALIVLYKISSNFIKMIRCLQLSNKYTAFLSGDETVNVYESCHEVQRLILGASVPDKIIPVVQPAGFGIVHTMKPTVLGQFPSTDGRFAYATLRMFEEAIGEYKHRCFEALNPLYWVETVIWLPKRFLNYLGISDSNIASKLLHSVLIGLYWIVVTAYLLFDIEIKALLLIVIERMKTALLS